MAEGRVDAPTVIVSFRIGKQLSIHRFRRNTDLVDEFTAKTTAPAAISPTPGCNEKRSSSPSREIGSRHAMRSCDPVMVNNHGDPR